ncbi:hypothetical protein SPRG_18605 [Saprolegnia parasitica CBS 223.65]|uniref:Uncharacterized protein n=1 Tax=Saprolegnia parasitica (strain CBS 223.65) TaxID=695850 RepID=A0A067BBX3_SAPPC|nr:hypothetical protein SPRG_18605 [Saprolegnia parasitica CBS 223.65]KDO15859.1 hypothetical protein SPRG_18605 [Saprolegnia parasitica CBS 223.65]|eukprot:XP_012213433.1 hypothetical protein SPRG_18605 [Saprolegnia parasitica CBS 223.65]
MLKVPTGAGDGCAIDTSASLTEVGQEHALIMYMGVSTPEKPRCQSAICDQVVSD